MSQPNFEAMTRKELKAHILSRRSDSEAFYAYLNKVDAEPPTEIFPAPKLLDDFQNFPLNIGEIPSRSSEKISN